MSAKRGGTEIKNNQLVSPTEKIVNMVASSSSSDSTPRQVLAGSATASRKTLDRLQRILRSAAIQEAASTVATVWGGDIQVCRPPEIEQVETRQDTTDDDEWVAPQEQQHTIRAVSVPEQVKHTFVALPKNEASSSDAVLATIAKVLEQLKPKSSLLFICGEFGKSKQAVTTTTRDNKGSPWTRSNAAANKKQKIATQAANKVRLSANTEKVVLSAAEACKTLAIHGIEAQPLHVALGLGRGATSDDSGDTGLPPVLVTFEEAARGLHLEEIDCVLVVGRPASAASYLHVAGRVGRSSPSANGEVVVRPGTVVSVCTKGSSKELAKWTKQVGASQLLEEIVLLQ
jgi:hypothetical protein